MFDHLDDPLPYAPSADLKPAVERRARSLKRRRRAALGTVAASLVVIAGVAGATTMVDRKLDDVERVDVANLRTATEPGDPKVVLFVGADSDQGLGAPVAEGEPRTGPFRTDTIILARVDPGTEELSILPIPRDLWVEIPGRGPGRINGAYAVGGAALLVETIDRNLGIEVDHYVQADFAGAVAIGDAIGGLSLSFDQPVRDDRTGLDLAGGCQRLGGLELLQLSRARHLEFLVDGTWRRDPTSDLGRIERQQAVGAALLGRLAQLDLSNPVELERLLDAAVGELRVDQATTNDDLLRLFRAIEGSTSQPLHYPVTDDVVGGAQVLRLGPGADQVTAAFLDADRPQPPRTPAPPDGSEETATTSAPAGPTSTTSTTTAVVVSTPAAAIPQPC